MFNDLSPGGIQYFYDPNDNRTRVVRNGQSEWYGVGLADKLLCTNTVGNWAPGKGQEAPYGSFPYDDLGQMIESDRRDRKGAWTMLDYAWDGDGRLRQVSQRGLAASQRTRLPRRIHSRRAAHRAHGPGTAHHGQLRAPGRPGVRAALSTPTRRCPYKAMLRKSGPS
jgi:hypothetical protein